MGGDSTSLFLEESRTWRVEARKWEKGEHTARVRGDQETTSRPSLLLQCSAWLPSSARAIAGRSWGVCLPCNGRGSGGSQHADEGVASGSLPLPPAQTHTSAEPSGAWWGGRQGRAPLCYLKLGSEDFGRQRGERGRWGSVTCLPALQAQRPGRAGGRQHVCQRSGQVTSRASASAQLPARICR